MYVYFDLGVVANAHHPSTWEVEAQGLGISEHFQCQIHREQTELAKGYYINK